MTDEAVVVAIPEGDPVVRMNAWSTPVLNEHAVGKAMANENGITASWEVTRQV